MPTFLYYDSDGVDRYHEMGQDPVLIGRRELATRALDVMEGRKITALLVTDGEGRIEGVVHLHDLWRTQLF